MPAAIALAEELHLFALDLQGRIAWNRFRLRAGWAEWREIPSSFTPASAPSVVTLQGGLTLLILGADAQLYQARLEGEAWSDWNAMSAAPRATDPPRLAVWQGEPLLFRRDETNRVQWRSFAGEWCSLPEVGPAASTPLPIVWDEQLHLLLVDPGGRLLRTSRSTGGRWSTPQAVPGAPRTLVAPAAVATRSALVVALVGERGQVYLARQGRLSGWHPWRRIADDLFTASSPAICSFEGRVYLFVTAEDGTIYLTATR